MSTLHERLLALERRANVVTDCVRLIEEELDRKTGLSGLAIKGAYALVRRIKPGIIREAADRLLDPFVERLEPLAANAADAPEAYLRDHANEVAEALLGVTDARAASTDNATLRKAYGKVRPTALLHVTQAVPAIVRLLAKYP